MKQNFTVGQRALDVLDVLEAFSELSPNTDERPHASGVGSSGV
jgi:hypothetical protein